MPIRDQICMSHIERQNLTIRMHMRRLTRLTNGFSKKWANLHAALALHFAWYNFCREILSNVVDGAGQAARCSISSPSLNFFPSKTWTISSEPLSLRQRTSA